MSEEQVIALKKQLQRIEEDCIHSAKSQFNAAARWNRMHYLIGIPAILVGALAGTAFFRSYEILAGLMAAGASVLVALMTFLKPTERSANHKRAGDQMLSLRNDVRTFREIRLNYSPDLAAVASMVEMLSKRRNELNEGCPIVSTADFDRARRGIDEGEAEYRADR